MSEIILGLENVSTFRRRRPVLDRVSFSVREGSVYTLLGRDGAEKSSIVGCLLGQEKPTSGDVFLFRKNPRKHRRELMRRVSIVLGQPKKEILSAAVAKEPDLLVWNDAMAASDAAGRQAFFDQLRRGPGGKPLTVFLTAPDSAGIEEIASHVGILKAGRLRIDEAMASLKSSFRKITYRNEITESRTDYGSELDEFDAVSVRVRGWGIEAVVRDYGEDKFERFRARDGVLDAAAAPVSLDEIFLAVVGPVAARSPM